MDIPLGQTSVLSERRKFEAPTIESRFSFTAGRDSAALDFQETAEVSADGSLSAWATLIAHTS